LSVAFLLFLFLLLYLGQFIILDACSVRTKEHLEQPFHW
jgi:hypothetical protein